MNELTIIKRGDNAYIDSREVAEIIGKDHRNLLRDIRGYAETLRKRGALNFELSSFFVESAYVSAQNKVMPCFLLSKMGCEMVATKLTGEKGILFSFAYVKRFNELEAAEREAEMQANSKPCLSEFNGAIKNVLSGMSDACVSPDGVMNFLREIYKPLGIRVADDGDTSCYYSAKDIAQFYKICSENGRPHSHAVAAIISKLNINKSHMIAVPYGLVGVTYRYDIDVAKAVMDWIIYNQFPSEVPYLDFNYHIYYDRHNTENFGNPDGFFLCSDYSSYELDEMCGKFGDCDDCPGKYAYCSN